MAFRESIIGMFLLDTDVGMMDVRCLPCADVLH